MKAQTCQTRPTVGSARGGRMSFKRYTRELYDRPTASLLPLKAWMVRSEVLEALIYGCATWTPLKDHYTNLLRRTHTIGCCFESMEVGARRRTSVSSRTKAPSSELNARASKDRAHEEVVVVGVAAPHGRPRLLQEGHVGRAGECGKTWAWGE